MALKVKYSARFKKDLKKIQRQGKDVDKLFDVLEHLRSEELLPEVYRDHKLSGDMFGLRECHIEPDWLLVYVINKPKGEIGLVRTGSHPRLFNE